MDMQYAALASHENELQGINESWLRVMETSYGCELRLRVMGASYGYEFRLRVRAMRPGRPPLRVTSLQVMGGGHGYESRLRGIFASHGNEVWSRVMAWCPFVSP